jgi:hypothetical protein
VGTSGGATFGVLATSAARVLFGSVRPDSWQVRADGRRVTAEPAGGLATSWVLPLGQDTVTVAPAGSDGQHLADVLMLLLWAVGIWTVRSRLRLGSKGPFNMANLELGSPSAEVMEIDWSDALDGQNVG